MDDSDTDTIELSRPEAQEVINALSTEVMTESGAEEERALNVREFLQREFGFQEPDLRDDSGNTDTLIKATRGLFSDSDTDTHEIQLSHAEAAEIDRALAQQEGSSEGEAETIDNLRRRFGDTFDLGR